MPRRLSPRTLAGAVLAHPTSRFVLPNGLTVLHRDVPGGLVEIQVWVKTGSIHEAPHLGSGMSHYLEHMLFKGTASRSAPEITAQVQAIGGDINAYTTYDRTVYHISCPVEGAGKAVEILHDMLFHSRLDDEELQRERDVILREIAMNMDDPDRRIARRVFETAFHDHPYRLPVIGYAELFSQIDADTLREYYRSRYTTHNMALVVAGDLPRENLEAMLQTTFAAERVRQTSTPFAPAEPAQLAQRTARMQDNVSVCRGSVAFRVPGLSHEDSPALDMLASILGGNESSVLNQSLRMKEGIVSEIDASCWNPGATGLFWISYVCDCGRYGRAESAIEKEISALIAKGIRKADLDKARLLAVSAMIDHHKTVSGQAARIGISEVVIGDLNYPAHYFDALWALTPEDIVKAAEKYLTPAACSVVTMDAPEARKAKASPRPEAPEAFRVITLPGGARIALQEDHALPKVSIRFGALGGPLYEDARTSGASALLATLLTRDTQVRDAGAVSELIEGCGGRMSDFSGNNSFGFAIEVLSGQLPKAIELFGDALLRPRVDANTFRIERESQIALLRENDDDITERGRIHMRRAFFGTHPYREQAEGTVEALEALKVEDIEDMRARLIRSGNAVVSICGDFKADEMVAEIGGILEQLPQSPFAPERPPFAPPPSSFVVEKMQREQAVVFHAFAGPGVLDPLYHASELLDEVLSDMSGPLFVNIRERKGLAYFVRSSRMNGLHAGMFTLMAGTKPDKCPEVRHEFDTALDEIRRTGLPQDVLQRARTRSKAGRRFATQTIGSRANCALLDVLYGQPVMTSHDYDAIIDATGNEQIRALATKYLDESRCLRFTIGPEGTL